MKILVGTSGWWYDHWQGKFYPGELEKTQWLPFYMQSFDTVEVNSSFYRLPFLNVVRSWARKAQGDFKFTVKMWRRITHLKKLRGVEESLGIFFERIEPLKGRLGAILYQLPPSLKIDTGLLDEFLGILPKDIDQVIEFRNESWLTNKTFSLLNKHNKAFCIVSMPKLPETCELTTDFSYVRFHGREGLYQSCYSDDELKRWAKTIMGFTKKKIKHVYAYFNNDYNAYAVSNALKLKELLGG